MKPSLLLSSWFVFLLFATGAPGESGVPKGAKELFYDPIESATLAVEPPAPPMGAVSRPREVARRPMPPSTSASSQLGLSYWIELVEAEGARGQRVTEQRIFRSGERIRLHFMSNRDGRISLLQAGPTGKSSMLFPDPGKNLVDTTLRAGEERILPKESAWFRFDQNTGEERIIVVFAADQDQLEATVGPEIQGATSLAGHRIGSKDLILEVETENAAQVGTYAVNTAGQPMVLEIVLRHE